MEIYQFYQICNVILYTFSKARDEVFAVTWGMVGGAILWVALFLLQGVGLYVMAKRRSFKHKWLAFLPFGNIMYMAKLAGECSFFGHKMKNAGLYAMLAQIVAAVLASTHILSEWYLYSHYGIPQQTEDLAAHWTGLSGYSLKVFNYYEISFLLHAIFSLVAQLLMLAVAMGLYKKYDPKNYMGLSMLTLFIAGARFITVFVLRENKAINYEDYIRARREEYIRRSQQYGGNPYGNPYGQNRPYGQNGNPYGNPYGQNGNPYGNPYGQANYGQPKPNDDPFEEFASTGKKTEDTPKGDDGGDGFFD